MTRNRRRLLPALAAIALALTGLAGAASAATAQTAAVGTGTLTGICHDLWDGVYAAPSSEPLAACQWDMALIGANDATRAVADGSGVRVGVIDSGVDFNHPDIAPNLDLADSCSFVRSDDPAILAGLADPSEAGNGDCSNKTAVYDRSGHGTHVASEIAAPVNGSASPGSHPRPPSCRSRSAPSRPTASATPWWTRCGPPATCGSTSST